MPRMLHIFVIIFSITLIVCNIIDSIGSIISIIGSTLVSVIISWKIAKFVGKVRNRNEIISTNKKAIIITGCDSGFGNRLAYKLNAIGFMVYATVLDTECDGSKHLQSNVIFPHLIKVIKMDVTNDAQVVTVYDCVRDDLELNDHILWGLVNNAGIATFGCIDWGTMQTYQNIFDVNVFGLVRVTRAFLPLIRQSKGRIVNMASISAILTAPVCSAYCMSKHAVLSFSDALRRETQQSGIKVSVILPGTFNTNLITEKYVHSAFDRVWDDTSNSVKQAYSSSSFDEIKKTFFSMSNDIASDNLDLVVDAIIDGLRGVCPQAYYTVAGDWGYYYIFIALLDYIPIELLDILVSKMTQILVKL